MFLGDSNTPMMWAVSSVMPIMLTTDGMMSWDSGGPPGAGRVPLEVPPASPRINWRNGAEPDSIRGKSIFAKKKS
jgi:hypothetical protein